MANISGIDLGTTYSALAMLNAIGKPQIVSNADGDRLTPSAIYFDEENSDTIRVGVEAVNSRHVNPDRSVRWIKRHMGDPDYRKVIDDYGESGLASSAHYRLGEAFYNDRIDAAIQQAVDAGITEMSAGALVVRVHSRTK